LLIGFFGFGFRVSGRGERLDGLAEVHAATRGHGRFQSVEAAGDIEILRDVSGGDTLADGLEATTGSGGIFPRERLDFPGDGSVVAKDIGRRSVHRNGVCSGSSIAIGGTGRSAVVASGIGRGGVAIVSAHAGTVTASGWGWTASGMRVLRKHRRSANDKQNCNQDWAEIFHRVLLKRELAGQLGTEQLVEPSRVRKLYDALNWGRDVRGCDVTGNNINTLFYFN